MHIVRWTFSPSLPVQRDPPHRGHDERREHLDGEALHPHGRDCKVPRDLAVPVVAHAVDHGHQQEGQEERVRGDLKDESGACIELMMMRNSSFEIVCIDIENLSSTGQKQLRTNTGKISPC